MTQAGEGLNKGVGNRVAHTLGVKVTGDISVTRNARFEKLTETSNIGPVRTRNRIIKTAAGMYYGNGDKKASLSMRL